MRPYAYVSIFGIPVSRMGMRDTVNYLCQAIRENEPHQVITVNPIMMMDALQKPDMMHVMQAAELLVPDGTGVVWAAGKKGGPVAERVAGFDLMHELLSQADRNGWRVFLLGASDEVIHAAQDTLKKKYIGAQFVGCRNGFFADEHDAEVIAAIREAEPHLLFVARSMDKQEPWIHRYKQELRVPVMMGVGGSFDVVSGKLKRAPLAWRRLRLEWLYRLLQEPWRYKRMLALPRFVWRVIRDREQANGPSL